MRRGSRAISNHRASSSRAAKLSENEARAAVRSGRAQVVLIIPEEYRCAVHRGDPGAGAAGRGQRGFANPQNRGSRQNHSGRLRQRHRAIAAAGPRRESAARRAGGGQRGRRGDPHRPRRGGAGFHDLFRFVRGIDGRSVSGHRFHGGGTGARFLGGAAESAGGALEPGGRQDSGHLRLHVHFTGLESHGLRLRVSFRAAGKTRHERQLGMRAPR